MHMQYHITAKGQHIILRINGVKCSELIDQEEGHFDLKGILGLQLGSGEPMTVQFKRGKERVRIITCWKSGWND